MRIAVCDDEAALRERLEQMAGEWSALRGCPCRVDAYPSGEAMLFETAGSYPYDLLLLDVELGGISGVDLARAVRETDRRVPIAFLTNHPGYVFQGYEVSALRYLLKPVEQGALFTLLDLARERQEREPTYLVLQIEGDARRVDQEDILCLEARGHRTAVHTINGVLEVKTAFSALSRKLGEGFVPAHRSFSVNLRYVEQVGRAECLLEGGLRIPVSRGAWEKLNQAFIRYYREV